MIQRRNPFLSYSFLILFGVTMLLPFAWMVLTSLKAAGEVFAGDAGLLPERWQWGNYVQVWREIPFFRYLLNSVFVAVVVTVGQVFTSSLAAYAFARLKFKVFAGNVAIPGVEGIANVG